MVFIESRSFTRRLAELAGDSAGDVLEQIQADLLERPERGRMVQGLGGIRKARASNPGRGKGKRGGFRYLYLNLERRGHVHLLFLLDKGEQEDLSEDERRTLRRMVAELKGI
ncbi:MAG: type II toxin-antitoxin system RelE/ParE family toxin [Terriglobia bacterium]